MNVRSTIALIYVIAAAIVAVVNGPGAGALAGELAVFSVFEADPVVRDDRPARMIEWEWEDPPAYRTMDQADEMRADLAPPSLLY